VLEQLRRKRERAAPRAPHDFIDMAHRRVFGAPVDRVSRRHYTALLDADGGGRLSLLAAMLRDPRHAERVVAHFDGAGLSDEAFVDCAYRRLLERDPDPEGRRTYVEALAGGTTRADLVRRIVRSDEYVERALPRYFPLADLRARRPDHYEEVENLAGETALVYRVDGPADFDWLETAILDGGYYDRPGVWRFEINTDKRVMAEIVAALEPASALELGCSTGQVLQCLDDLGVAADGVEISGAAIAAAAPEVRGRIHLVNATEFDLGSRYDAVFGLDLFEHLNPNRLAGCLARIAAHLNPGGFVFGNVPAFGEDAVFGTVFEVYLKPWLEDCRRGTPFHTLHTDDLGYPLNGHLIWAHTDWWVERFESAGLRREPGIERALHARYDTYFERETPARRSFYVFSMDAPRDRCERIAAAISAGPSPALAAAAPAEPA
jgi:Domain of unknown function (DUF4214)/Methyltransferase domain